MELDEAIERRTSVMYFDERPLSEETILRLVESAIRAPTASGLENWLFGVFRSEEARERLYDPIAERMVEHPPSSTARREDGEAQK